MENQSSDVDERLKRIEDAVTQLEDRIRSMERSHEIVISPLNFMYKFCSFVGKIAKEDLEEIENEIEKIKDRRDKRIKEMGKNE